MRPFRRRLFACLPVGATLADSELARMHAKVSFSQTGEDLIVRFIFDMLHIALPSYLDIGAHHPFYLNNTALLYAQGSRGLNVEPNPELFSVLQSHRPEDTNLNIGIAGTDGEATYIEFSTPTLNTFSQAEADLVLERDPKQRIVRRKSLPVLSLRTLLNWHCAGVYPDFLSADVEGVDLLVAQDVAETPPAARPKVICAETLEYAVTGIAAKKGDIVNLYVSAGYMAFADTQINTIFVRRDLYQTR